MTSPSQNTVNLVRPEKSAVETILEIRAGHLSPLDVINNAIERIEEVEPVLNAMTATCFEQAQENAKAIQDTVVKTGKWPALCGLPMVVKDNVDLGGLRTSGGSAVTLGGVATVSDPIISALERNGAIGIGKSNLSELGGANTTNKLFGPTVNPYDVNLTAGGSSGGTAAALAAGEVFFGHGNDVGGSLRTPAAFCGVAGLRPTPGIIPRRRHSDPFDTVFVEGPMARDIPDLALMLDAMLTTKHSDLLCGENSGGYFDAANKPQLPERVATSVDLGFLPVEASVRKSFTGIIQSLCNSGLHVDEKAPDLLNLIPHIQTLRSLSYATAWQDYWPTGADEFTHDVQNDIMSGMQQSGASIARAQMKRTSAFRRSLAFFETYDLLICPTTQVMPFSHAVMWPTEIDGTKCDTYMDWITITYLWSMLGHPALAVPVGHDENGLPISIQIIGPPRSEKRIIQMAAWVIQNI